MDADLRDTARKKRERTRDSQTPSPTQYFTPEKQSRQDSTSHDSNMSPVPTNDSGSDDGDIVLNLSDSVHSSSHKDIVEQTGNFARKSIQSLPDVVDLKKMDKKDVAKRIDENIIEALREVCQIAMGDSSPEVIRKERETSAKMLSVTFAKCVEFDCSGHQEEDYTSVFLRTVSKRICNTNNTDKRKFERAREYMYRTVGLAAVKSLFDFGNDAFVKKVIYGIGEIGLLSERAIEHKLIVMMFTTMLSVSSKYSYSRYRADGHVLDDEDVVHIVKKLMRFSHADDVDTRNACIWGLSIVQDMPLDPTFDEGPKDVLFDMMYSDADVRIRTAALKALTLNDISFVETVMDVAMRESYEVAFAAIQRVAKMPARLLPQQMLLEFVGCALTDREKCIKQATPRELIVPLLKTMQAYGGDNLRRRPTKSPLDGVIFSIVEFGLFVGLDAVVANTKIFSNIVERAFAFHHRVTRGSCSVDMFVKELIDGLSRKTDRMITNDCQQMEQVLKLDAEPRFLVVFVWKILIDYVRSVSTKKESHVQTAFAEAMNRLIPTPATTVNLIAQFSRDVFGSAKDGAPDDYELEDAEQARMVYDCSTIMDLLAVLEMLHEEIRDDMTAQQDYLVFLQGLMRNTEIPLHVLDRAVHDYTNLVITPQLAGAELTHAVWNTWAELELLLCEVIVNDYKKLGMRAPEKFKKKVSGLDETTLGHGTTAANLNLSGASLDDTIEDIAKDDALIDDALYHACAMLHAMLKNGVFRHTPAQVAAFCRPVIAQGIKMMYGDASTFDAGHIAAVTLIMRIMGIISLFSEEDCKVYAPVLVSQLEFLGENPPLTFAIIEVLNDILLSSKSVKQITEIIDQGCLDVDGRSKFNFYDILENALKTTFAFQAPEEFGVYEVASKFVVNEPAPEAVGLIGILLARYQHCLVIETPMLKSMLFLFFACFCGDLNNQELLVDAYFDLLGSLDDENRAPEWFAGVVVEVMTVMVTLSVSAQHLVQAAEEKRKKETLVEQAQEAEAQLGEARDRNIRQLREKFPGLVRGNTQPDSSKKSGKERRRSHLELDASKIVSAQIHLIEKLIAWIKSELVDQLFEYGETSLRRTDEPVIQARLKISLQIVEPILRHVNIDYGFSKVSLKRLSGECKALTDRVLQFDPPPGLMSHFTKFARKAENKVRQLNKKGLLLDDSDHDHDGLVVDGDGSQTPAMARRALSGSTQKKAPSNRKSQSPAKKPRAARRILSTDVSTGEEVDVNLPTVTEEIGEHQIEGDEPTSSANVSIRRPPASARAPRTPARQTRARGPTASSSKATSTTKKSSSSVKKTDRELLLANRDGHDEDLRFRRQQEFQQQQEQTSRADELRAKRPPRRAAAVRGEAAARKGAME